MPGRVEAHGEDRRGRDGEERGPESIPGSGPVGGDLVAMDAREGDADRDDRQRQRRPGHDAFAQGDRDQRRERPFRRGDRSDDPDFSDAQRGVDEDEAAAVAEAHDHEPADGREIERCRHADEDGARERDRQADEHHPGDRGGRTDDPRRARRRDRGGGPQQRGAKAAEDGEHSA